MSGLKKHLQRMWRKLVLEDTKEVINNSHGTGYAAHRTDIILAGKTGTAEIKASKDDTTGTELGWFSVFTTDEEYGSSYYDRQHGRRRKRKRWKRLCCQKR